MEPPIQIIDPPQQPTNHLLPTIISIISGIGGIILLALGIIFFINNNSQISAINDASAEAAKLSDIADQTLSEQGFNEDFYSAATDHTDAEFEKTNLKQSNLVTTNIIKNGIIWYWISGLILIGISLTVFLKFKSPH